MRPGEVDLLWGQARYAADGRDGVVLAAFPAGALSDMRVRLLDNMVRRDDLDGGLSGWEVGLSGRDWADLALASAHGRARWHRRGLRDYVDFVASMPDGGLEAAALARPHGARSDDEIVAEARMRLNSDGPAVKVRGRRKVMNLTTHTLYMGVTAAADAWDASVDQIRRACAGECGRVAGCLWAYDNRPAEGVS